MSNNILSWIKGNYEKLILGALLILLIVTGLHLFGGVDRNKELEDFKIKILPPSKPIALPPIYNTDLGPYLVGKSFSEYQLISDRAVFFPVEIKKPDGSSAPQMNLECTGVVSGEGGVFTATFRNPQSGKIYKAQEGEKIENWTVVSVTRNIVIISGNDKQYRLNPPVVTMPFRLTGIMPLENGFQAMLQSDSTKKTYFINTGEEVEGWKVLSINGNTVIISRPDAGEYEVKIGGEFQRIQE